MFGFCFGLVFLIMIVIHCAGHKALTSKTFLHWTDLPGWWHRASCWAGTDWVYFQLTSIYLPVITSSWLFALALHLPIAPVLSKGLTQAFWIPYRISSTSLIVSLSPDTSIPCLYLICILINTEGDRCDWLQPLSAARLLSVAEL